MSDNQKTVKSKISMDLKNRNKGPAKQDTYKGNDIHKDAVTDAQNHVKKTTSVENTVSQHDPLSEPKYAEVGKRVEGNNLNERSPTTPGNDSKTQKAYKNKFRKRLFMFAAVLWLLLMAILVIIIRYEDAGHYYYVESTIAPPSEVETKSNALVLGSCVRDFTMNATPAELTKIVQDEYNYQGNSDDYVQTLVRTGCDTDLSLPMIHHGSAINAMF